MMGLSVEIASRTHVGRVRKRNEDVRCLGRTCPAGEETLLRRSLKDGVRMAVFDGMGGENFGDAAARTAAEAMAAEQYGITDRFRPVEAYLHRLTAALNAAVVAAGEALGTSRMGTTMVWLGYARGRMYVCNVGDSRAYRLRGGELTQLSRDHVDARPPRPGRKPALTQYLGIPPEEMRLVPHIAGAECRRGDRYLLCSDGLTDMLAEEEIAALLGSGSADACAGALIAGALDRGGRDNVTVIVCDII